LFLLGYRLPKKPTARQTTVVKAKTRIIVISNETQAMELNMLVSTKQASIAIAATLMLSMPLAPAFSASAASNTAPQSQVAAAFRSGDLVRVRSGGPLMTVRDIQGDKVNCSWTDWLGDLKSDSFPIAALQGPITPPVKDPNVEQVE
jgi:uncharacterized protein YodC (DUF2158 family)